ncbi:nitrate reductase [Paracoccus aestuarii]|nr:nitrate reductase [Paracoccus aestuarii]WCQ99179.1 molybdopterin-dependent oxidoreductase [Paracoccus aestuarii]
MTVRTTCPYCGVGCGVLATPDGQGGLTVRGDPDHPANRGRLCVKGAALGETVAIAGRLLAPRIGGQDASWDGALDLIAARFSETVARHGPDSVAMYVSGQLLTEDYYAANKLMKGFIGSANIDTNSRLCMASSVAGHRRAFGSDTVPGLYEDLELADLVVLTGSNLAWCHPVLHQRLMAARAARPDMRIVVIDPRRTATCEGADLHLAIAPGADGHLFNLLLAHLHDTGRTGGAFLTHVAGYDDALRAARASRPQDTGLPPEALRRFLDLWAGTERTVTVYSQGINQSDSGTDKVNAIINCHLATGRIGRPGMGPFSVTGQPNAMGGREVGGLSNTLACHLELENPAHRAAVGAFWAAPNMAHRPGLKAVDLFRAVGDGRIKALWIMHTNPAVTMPEADRVARAIAACDFTVVSEAWPETDTARLADVLLPSAAWGEKDGAVTNSERMISRQRAVLAPPGQARPDWWQIAQVATRMGFAGFDWSGPGAVFAEHAALSGVAGDLGGDFDISDLAAADYEALAPTTWPQNARQRGGRFFGEGRFHTPDGRARMIAVSVRAPDGVPFRLNTGRIRDQWHTMTRTGLSPRLSAHLAEPYLQIHPADAADLGLGAADLARVRGQGAQAVLRVMISGDVRRGHPFAPIHFTGLTAPSGRIGAVVGGLCDPVSGQPAGKSAPVAVTRYAAAWHGFLVSRVRPRPDCAYWAQARLADGWQVEMADEAAIPDWPAALERMLGLGPPTAWMRDPARGTERLAIIRDGRLEAALFVGPGPVPLSRGHLGASLGREAPGVLSGRAPRDRPDPGPVVCACLSVGRRSIEEAAASGADTVERIAAALGAGGNCGSCRPEIASLLAGMRDRAIAAQ